MITTNPAPPLVELWRTLCAASIVNGIAVAVFLGLDWIIEAWAST